MPVTIANVVYRTQKALKAAVDARAPNPTDTIQTLPLDEFWIEYLSYSETFADKAAELRDPSSLMVGYHLFMGSLQLVVCDATGDYRSFSYRDCTRNAFVPKADRELSEAIKSLKMAARNAIQPQIDAFRRSRTAGRNIRCAVTKVWHEAHEIDIDHHPIPFDQIVTPWLEAWIEANGLPAVTTTHSADADHQTFTDPAVAKAFARHHEEVATLRPVVRSVNLSKSKAWQ